MNSRVTWSVDGIDPSVRERAEAAARRAGMSFNEWITSNLGDAPPNFRYPPPPSRDVADIHQRLDSITRQIEQISRTTPRNDASREQGVARQLNDAISRLDARLSQISNPQYARQANAQTQERQQRQADTVERAAGQVYADQAYSSQGYPNQAGAPQAYRNSPPLSPASLDFAVAEIAARQSELDAPPPRAMSPRQAPPMAPANPPGPDFSSLERHLLKITSQIEALQRPDHLEQSIAAFRNELAEIRAAITEAMPRRAIESIESEIRSLSRRIDDNRDNAVDDKALASIERALAEIREVLGSLMPAEQLAGYDEAIRNLGAKLDMILRANDDPSTVRQLESAITALRAIVSNVASNDALARLSEDVHLLSSKVDQLVRAGNNSGSFAALEQRIVALTSALESRERSAVHDNSERIEGALRSLSDRIDRLPVRGDHSEQIESALRTLSDRIERLPVSNDHSEQIEGALRALSDRIERLPVGNDHSEQIEGALRALSGRIERLPVGNDHSEQIEGALRTLSDRIERLPAGNDHSEQIESALRSLSDRIDRLQVGNDNASTFAHLEQRVSYLLERLENSDGHRAGNLANVEEGLQDILHHLERQHAAFANFTAENSRNSAPPDSGLIDLVKRELSDIRFSQSEKDRHTQDSLEAVHSTLGHVVDRLAMIEGDLRAASTAPAQAATAPTQAAVEPETDSQPVAMSPLPNPELPNPAAAQETFAAAPREFGAVEPVAPPEVPPPPLAISEILAPHAAAAPRPAFAPDLPPDHPLEPGTRPSGRVSTPSERIAASEDAIREIPAAPRPPVSSASFIAAARRAAQAAAAQPPGDLGTSSKAAGKGNSKEPSTITSKIRSVLVAASVVVIVLGTFKMAMTLLENSSAPPAAPAVENSPAPAPAQPPEDSAAKPAIPDQLAPSITSPTPIGRQSLNIVAPNAVEASTSVDIPQAAAAPATSPIPGDEITGAIPAANGSRPAMVPVPPSERLPEGIGGPLLRAAALKGDPTAVYEIGLRFAEGKGVPQNFDEATKWYDRAARAGLVPAIFRLGTFYEKGLGVKKDVDIARRYYLQAAERGNAKAMHNLAVLDADGGGKGANYKSAAQWFRKAADRGVADSQFNLGILYARGIGVEQNLAESFKWFSLAAAQGDADSAQKRDDIAKRLDAQSLAAAKLAIQTFTAEPQPDDAVNVETPAGGWDSAAPQAATAKPAAKSLSTKRASR